MDDPWGSPWASSETTSKQDPTPSPPKNLLSPPPKAFFGSTLNLPSQSPWADDAGFGDWAGAEQADALVNALDWGVWAESSRSPQPSPKPDEPGKRDSIAWPSSTATSPGLRPLPRSRTSSIFRHNSPDPWAADLSLHDRKNDSIPTSSRTPQITDAGPPSESIKTPVLAVKEQRDVKCVEAEDDVTQLEEETEKSASKRPKEWEPSSMPADTREPHGPDADPASKVEVHDIQSRPSSTFSLDSYNAADRQDSPITSVDEDPKSRLQTTPRKASGKVQELVGIYDDLAKSITEESPASTRPGPSRSENRERSPSQARSLEAGVDIDFGDFEDASSIHEKPAPSSNASSTFSGGSPTPKARPEDVVCQDRANEPTSRQSTKLRKASVPVQQLIEKFGPIRFDIDLKSIEKLFPGLADDVGGDAKETSEVSDRIINDSFTTIPERKTWYRISRYGSMRKHDSGDEDNYHRVEWPTSHLHSDTIKIVRRWMEEDSISGRVTLGAGKRTSVFNWDSSAAPVDLGKVFARKLSITHSRSNSAAIPESGSERPTQPATPDSEVRKSMKSPIEPPDPGPRSMTARMPSFGWSSNAIKSPPISPPTPNNPRDSNYADPINRPASVLTGAGTRAAPAVPTPREEPNKSEVVQEDEDEDDWGEMVSSPRVESQSGVTLATQSLDTNNTTPVQVTLANGSSKPDIKTTSAKQNSNPVAQLSISIPQSSRDPKQMPSQARSANAKTQRVDPWPLADFSIFEQATRTPKSSKQDPSWPLADLSVFESPTSASTSNWGNSLKTKSELSSKSRENNQTGTTKVVETEAPLKAVLGPIQKSDRQQDQDDIARRIVQNLPDLSYMLH
ncbi:hypothetical protein AAE478_004480 [Parahypoxylon ruwenzoriense]